MKNPFLPDPKTHPRLYAREYLRQKPLYDAMAACVACLVAVPVGGWLFFWFVRLVFAL